MRGHTYTSYLLLYALFLSVIISTSGDVALLKRRGRNRVEKRQVNFGCERYFVRLQLASRSFLFYGPWLAGCEICVLTNFKSEFGKRRVRKNEYGVMN